MGFMNKLSKMKNFLFDEEEVEEKPVKKQTKKIIKKQEEKPNIVEEKYDKKEEIENLYIEDINDVEPVISSEVKSRTLKNESTFKFPEFNDDDFAIKKPIVEVAPPIIKEEPKPVLYQGSKRKEEIKKFKPSPIISPVYGLLDENGKKVKKEEDSKESKLKTKEDITFDEVRRKAYGEIEKEDIEEVKNLSSKTIGEAEKEMNEKIELSRIKEKAKKEEKEIENNDEDDMILPNVNFKEIDVDKERLGKNVTKKTIVEDDDDDDDTKEQDLFNLIDSIYQEKEKEN